MITDPIADLLTRIRNASCARKNSVLIPYSQFKEKISKILLREGIFQEVKVVRNGKFPELKIYLKDADFGLTLVRKSTPGRRVYLSCSDIRPVKNGFGVGIFSTSKGLLTAEEAKSEGVGGEYVCEVY
jgi:small subunit ribosomal protein S8